MTARDEDLEARAGDVLAAWFEKGGGAPSDLAELCGEDAELRRRVEEMIAEAPAVFEAFAALPGGTAPSGFDGDRLGEFRLLGALGEGGMGRVFLAIQESLGRPVALKVLDQSRLRDPQAAARFRREAEIAARLDHPNIVPIYGLGEDQGCAWIAMKWLTGPGLDRLPEPLPPQQAAELGACIARALDAAHAAGIVHRDVKPANVIFDDGKPCLVDFGLARSAGDATLTRPGVVPGTLPYMAPEQLRSGAGAMDPRTDVYALGATLYEAVTGGLPFPEDDPERLIRAILERDPVPPALPAAHADLGTIMLRALEKDSGRRFPTAAAMADELDRYLRGEPILSRRSGVLSRVWKLVRRHRRPAAAIAISVLVAASALALWVVGLRSDAAALDETLAAARAALERGEFGEARYLARAAQRDHPGDEDVLALARSVAAREAVEALLDQIQDRAAAQNSAVIDSLVARLDENGGGSLDPRRTGLALALIDIHRGRPEAARRRLDSVEALPPPGGGPGRDLDALRAAAAGIPAIVLPDRMEADPERHVFAALALRAAGAPPDQQLREIEKACAADDKAVRPKIAKAVFLADAGRHAEAMSAFEGLSATGIAKALIHRNRARLHVIAGELDRAEAQLLRVPGDERNTGTDLLEIEILRRRGQAAEADRRVESLLEARPLDPMILFDAAVTSQAKGRWEEAWERLEKARDLAGHAALRDGAEAVLLALELIRAAGSADPAAPVKLDAGGRAAVREVEKAAAGLAVRTREPAARGRALAAEGWARKLLGDAGGAVSLLESAIAADPDNAGHRSNFLAYALELAAASEIDDLGRAPLLAAAEEQARRLISGEGRGVAPPSPEHVDEAALALAVIACERGDKEACAAAAQAVKVRLVKSDRPARLPDVEDLLRWARSP